MTEQARKMAGRFEALPLPYESMFARTQYFEIDSVVAEARYAVWVTVPNGYDNDPAGRFPVVFMPDGNNSVMMSARLADLSMWDMMDRFRPTIQVAVGYTGDDASRMLAVRARDLLPPKEALAPGSVEQIKSGAFSKILDAATADLYVHHLQNPAGDRFLSFLTDELYPFIARNYRVREDALGLFGHSYGGLFTTYASLQANTIFKNIGASSPGILENSVLFSLYDEAVARGGLPARNLHMTIATREVTDSGMYQQMVGAGTVDFMRRVGTAPLPGLHFTSRFIEHETHATVGPVAMFNFMRAFYLGEA